LLFQHLQLDNNLCCPSKYLYQDRIERTVDTYFTYSTHSFFSK